MLKFVLVLIAATATSLPCWSSDSLGTSAPVDTIRITIPRYPYTGDWGAMDTIYLSDTSKHRENDGAWCGRCLLVYWFEVKDARQAAIEVLIDETCDAYQQANAESDKLWGRWGQLGYGLDSYRFWIAAYAEKLDSCTEALIEEYEADIETQVRLSEIYHSDNPTLVVIAESDSSAIDNADVLAERIRTWCTNSVNSRWDESGSKPMAKRP